jgi:hypothetical protein
VRAKVEGGGRREERRTEERRRRGERREVCKKSFEVEEFNAVLGYICLQGQIHHSLRNMADLDQVNGVVTEHSLRQTLT